MGGSGMNKNIWEGFTKLLIPELCLTWWTVVILIENPGKDYPRDGLLEELQNIGKADDEMGGLDQEESLM